MEKKQFDVTALGELLIDFTENGEQYAGKSPDGSKPGRCTVQRTCHAGASW